MREIYKKILIFADTISFSGVLRALLLSIIILVGGLLTANRYYELSKYPVQLFAGQLAF